MRGRQNWNKGEGRGEGGGRGERDGEERNGEVK